MRRILNLASLVAMTVLAAPPATAGVPGPAVPYPRSLRHPGQDTAVVGRRPLDTRLSLDGRGSAGPRQQAGTVRGTVVDARTEQPLARVFVRLADTAHVMTTGPDGRFELRGIAPGDYVLTVSVVGYALIRRPIVMAPGGVLEFTVVLAAGSGTYEERVDVVAPVFDTREPGTPAEATIGATELKDLGVLVADDPLRAVQALPGVTATDDFSSEFSARGSGPRNTGVILDGVPAASVLLHIVEGRDDTGSIARIHTDVLSRTSLLLGSYPQRYGDRLGPQLEFTTRDGSRSGFHLRGIVSTIAAAAVAEGAIAGGRGSWLTSVRQSYLDWVIRRLEPGRSNSLGFTDSFGKVVFDVSSHHQLSLSLLGGRAHYEEVHDTPGPNTLHDAVSRGGLAIVGLRSTGTSWVLNQRVFLLGNRFQNLRVDGVELGSGRRNDIGYRADASHVLSSRFTLDLGAHLQRTSEGLDLWTLDRKTPPGRTTAESFDRAVTRGGAFGQIRWQSSSHGTVTAGGRVDGWSGPGPTTASPWVQFEQRFPRGWTLRTGAGLYHQTASFDQIWGVHGGGSAIGAQRAFHADVSVEQVIGARTRWQVSFFNREERDVAWAPGLEPRTTGARVPFNAHATYATRLRGYARGVEAVVQRRDPNGLSGWVAYAFGHSRFTDPVADETFDGDYDQRHTLSTYTSLRLGSRTTVVTKFRAGSNIPVRGYYRPTGQEDADGLPVFTLGPSRNDGRLPTYARLDLRVNQAFNFSTRRLTLFVELINVLDRTNGGMSGGRYVEKLLPFIPAAGFLVEF